jgi:hypothetical protein
MIPQNNSPAIIDHSGIIHRGFQALPDELKLRFLAILAELENPDCYQKKRFPQANLKRVLGTQLPLYTANIDVRGDWKLYLYYAEGKLYLKELTCYQKTPSSDSLSEIIELNEF